jgi:uncharacterized protein
VAHPNEVLVREAFAAFGRGDMDALRSQYFAEDIRWHTPGRSPLAGDYEGVAQVLEAFGRVFELSGARSVLSCTMFLPMKSTPWRIIPPAPSGRPSIGRTTSSTSSISVTAKQTEVWLYSADLYAFDEFWS